MFNFKMSRRFLVAIFTLALAESAWAADVGVSVSIGQPGFYGHIDIGDYPYPQPRAIYREPIIVHRHFEEREPIYLRVPPGHAKKWYRYCDRYNACDRPVYFVDDRWYNEVYVPQYRERHGDEGYGRRDDDRRQDGRDERHGHGRGHDRD